VSLRERIRVWIETNLLGMPPGFTTKCDACGKTITRKEVGALTEDKVLGKIMRYWCKNPACRNKAMVGVPGDYTYTENKPEKRGKC